MIRDSKALEAYVGDLLDSMPDASFMVDASGRIVLANALMEKMLGYGPRGLHQKSLDSLIPERFRRQHAGHCSNYFAQPRARPMGAGLSLYALRKDGTEAAVEISLSPINTDSGTYVLGAIRGLTESEERYRAIFEQIAVGVVHSNFEGRVLNANRKFCELSGFTREETLSLNIRDLTHSDDIDRSVEARTQLLAGQRASYAREAHLLGKDGTEIWAHITTTLIRSADGRPLHFISLLHDVSQQKQAERDRDEMERRFRQVTENIRDVVWLTDSARSEMLYVSPAYESIWGRSAGTLRSAPGDWFAAIHAEDRDRVVGAAQAMQVTGTYSEEYRVVRPDGSLRWIWDRAFPVRDDRGRVVRVAGIAEDVTDRKHAADELRESERRFGTLLQNIELVAVMLDRDGRITYCNDFLLRLTGWTREELTGRNWSDLFVPPELKDKIRQVFESLLADRPDAWHYENEILTRAGERRLIRWNNTVLRSPLGEAVGTASIGEDITDRRRNEVALRESEERFRAMIEQSISGTCIIDAEQRFVYVNPRLAAILGFDTPASIIGRPVLEFVALSDHALVVDNMRERMAGVAQSARYNFQAIRRDRSLVTLGAHGTLGTYGGKRVVIATVQDVTELRRAELEVERTLARLQRAVQSTIEVVSTMGELRDPYTHGHEHRVGEVATAIASEMALSPDMIEGVRIAGYLHDVGKIAVPAEILAKPSKLTKLEFELVKQHAQQSYDILRRVDFPWPVAEAAWQHHERLDGSGYPRGLRGDEIIIEARIIAVADTVEAIASHRPYRPGYGIEKALSEISRGRGTEFDAQVVDACLRLFRARGFTIPA